ncbi:high mobility group nucleosomal binding domain 1, isoform CRA_a [Mus musculus]|nr:high mobility group nucleosomal binding domain 1, isoform CRA_a [Mus musculus]
MEPPRRSPSAAPRGCRPSPPLPRWTRSRKRPRERVQPLKKRKKLSPTKHPSRLSVVPPPFLYNPEEYFYQLFCKCEFFSSSRNIFKR